MIAHGRSHVPNIQVKFAFNAGPEGLSFVIGPNDNLIYRGPYKKPDGFIVNLAMEDDVTLVTSCEALPGL